MYWIINEVSKLDYIVETNIYIGKSMGKLPI